MKKAYVTTLYNGDGYLPGVEVLGRSLEVSGSREMRIVLVTSDIETPARERLAKDARRRNFCAAPQDLPLGGGKGSSSQRRIGRSLDRYDWHVRC
jgi:hypothetical protein